jgi:hypothetical protein
MLKVKEVIPNPVFKTLFSLDAAPEELPSRSLHRIRSWVYQTYASWIRDERKLKAQVDFRIKPGTF